MHKVIVKKKGDRVHLSMSPEDFYNLQLAVYLAWRSRDEIKNPLVRKGIDKLHRSSLQSS